jgi:hypothetical protein
MSPDYFSLITCTDKKTKVQREHLDDIFRGVAAFWGLCEGQYVIVWLWSYEMNLKLETIWQYYVLVVSHTPTGWTKEEFWNLVAEIHLESQGFKD